MPVAPPSHSETVSFLNFEIDVEKLELRHLGIRVPIQAKPLGILLELYRRRDRIVSKVELMRQVWPDVVVSDHALTSALRDLRRALGDTQRERPIIVTIRGRGYRMQVGDGAARTAAEPLRPLRGRCTLPAPHGPSTMLLTPRP